MQIVRSQLPLTTILLQAQKFHRSSAAAMFTSEIFSEANRLKTMDSLQSQRVWFPGDGWVGKKLPKKAAVLIPFCYNENNEPSLLYTLRSSRLNNHKGEISFPGGKQDPEDNDDLVVTALREMEEEVGIPKTEVDVWGTLGAIPTLSTMMSVTPVIGFINKKIKASELTVSPEEVEVAFTVPLEHLCNSENWDTYSWSKSELLFPVFTNLGKFMGRDDVKLWGLTAIFTHITLLSLVPEYYQRQSLWGSSKL